MITPSKELDRLIEREKSLRADLDNLDARITQAYSEASRYEEECRSYGADIVDLSREFGRCAQLGLSQGSFVDRRNSAVLYAEHAAAGWSHASARYCNLQRERVWLLSSLYFAVGAVEGQYTLEEQRAQDAALQNIPN